MKLTDEQLMDILKEGIKAIALKYNSIVAENKEEEVTVKDTVTMEVAPKEIPKKVVEETPVMTEKVEERPQVVEEPKTVAQEPKSEVTTTRDVLEAMSYNELKVLAKETGVKAIGSKLSLIEKILEAQANSVDPNTTMTTEEVEEVEEQEETAPQEEETVEFEEEPIEDEDEEENLYTKLVKETMDMSDEEIADLLADVGISPKGRRQALLSKLEQAVRDGLIAFGDEEDEEPTQIEEEVVDNGVQEEEEKEEEVIEIAGSEERIAKVEELYERYLTDYEEGEISDKDVQDFLKDYYNEGAEYSEIVEIYTNEEMAEPYALIHAQLVDDEGEEYDEKSWKANKLREDEKLNYKELLNNGFLG